MGKFESYPSISALADDDITLINHNTVTHKISFATLATLIKNRIGLQVDNVPTKDSINLATSGGIYSMIKDEEDRAISVENTKGNQATTLSGYGITDAYTKTEADNKFSTFSGSYNDLINKPTIPTKTSQLINDSDFVIDSNYVHTDNNFTTTLKTKLNGIASGAEVNVQSDWNETDTTSDAYIANKPTIPSEVTVDSALSTSSTNPVQNKIITNALANKVDDTDLATVAKSGSYNDLINKPTLGTAAAKNSTNAVTSGSADLVESGAVYDFVGKTLTAQTLAVGATTLTFTDSSIDNNSRIRVISNPFTSGLLNAVQNGNTVTLTFDAQEVALSVTLEVRN